MVAVAAVARAVVARIEEEAPRGVAVRVRDGRPVVATETAARSPVAVAGSGEEYASGSIRTPTMDKTPIDAVLPRPIPVALIDKVS